MKIKFYQLNFEDNPFDNDILSAFVFFTNGYGAIVSCNGNLHYDVEVIKGTAGAWHFCNREPNRETMHITKSAVEKCLQEIAEFEE